MRHSKYQQLLTNQKEINWKLNCISNLIKEKDIINTFSYKDYIFHLGRSSIEISCNNNYCGSLFQAGDHQYYCVRKDGSISMPMKSDYLNISEIFTGLLVEHNKNIDYMTSFQDAIIELVQVKENEN